jgi:ferrochelatase
LSFQSRAGKARWLEPATDDVLRLLARTGRKDVLAIPISFVSDHIETLYEIDILFGDEARALGLNFHRAPSLNTEPLFIEALAQLVEARLAQVRPAENVGATMK